jgi:hypothetical protein
MEKLYRFEQVGCDELLEALDLASRVRCACGDIDRIDEAYDAHRRRRLANP